MNKKLTTKIPLTPLAVPAAMVAKKEVGEALAETVDGTIITTSTPSAVVVKREADEELAETVDRTTVATIARSGIVVKEEVGEALPEEVDGIIVATTPFNQKMDHKWPKRQRR